LLWIQSIFLKTITSNKIKVYYLCIIIIAT
jgi:hypothetical protein